MFILMRTLTYATLFVGFLFFYLPGRVLAWSGVPRPSSLHALQFGGITLAALGVALAVWCVGTFVSIGKGTPAPFDPPRRLVVRGPYRFVRNPMYIGAAGALAGTALFYGSTELLAFVCGFALVTHLFVIAYEEPTLQRSFGSEYAAYCERVRRWWPHLRSAH